MAAQLSIRVPDEMKEQLEKVAEQDDRSVAFVVKKAIQNYLDTILNEEEN